ncbi:DNA-binding protein [Dyella sp. 20L07]|uniref:DNA-binding protein n=1 Tax=Dyella sp. 20L07 TaxID=3384240 RepID=UPI003D28A7BE
MRTGITQDQVNAAADAIVGAGENPTVEKVRMALGTGSPNTVTRMLDVWRTQLGRRLQQVNALPELPTAVGQAMRELWHLAATEAETTALTHLANDRAALNDDRLRLADERTRWSATLDDAATAVTQAQTKQQLAEQACTTLDDQLQDSHALRTDLLQQRDRLQAQCDQQGLELSQLRTELQQRDAALMDTRQRHDTHVQTVEDHAHREVDRARQETKAAQQRLSTATREHARALAAWKQQWDALLQTQRDLEQRVAHEAGRAAALAAHVSRPATRTTKAPIAAKKVRGTTPRPHGRKK